MVLLKDGEGGEGLGGEGGKKMWIYIKIQLQWNITLLAVSRWWHGWWHPRIAACYLPQVDNLRIYISVCVCVCVLFFTGFKNKKKGFVTWRLTWAPRLKAETDKWQVFRTASSHRVLSLVFSAPSGLAVFSFVQVCQLKKKLEMCDHSVRRVGQRMT